MTNTTQRNSSQFKIPLASILWLKYLGIVFALFSLYNVARFYYYYGDDIFPKSITIGQHFKLSMYSIGSMLYELIIPILFFSGALLYHSVRSKEIGILTALKRDALIIIPLGFSLWYYGAFLEPTVKAKFHAMLYDIKNLQPGEKLVQDANSYKIFKSPDLNGLHNEIDALDIKIIALKKQSPNHDTQAMANLIEELQMQQLRYQNEIIVIHLRPFYVLLFFVFGLLLGYLIQLPKVALIAILVVIGYSWYYSMSIIEFQTGFNFSNVHLFLLFKIGLLVLVNIILFIVTLVFFKRSKKISI